MKLGLFSINMESSARPDAMARVVRSAEAAGFESVWAGEHVILPDPQMLPSPMAPSRRGRLTPERAAGFAEVGVDRLVVYPRAETPEAVEAAIEASVAAVASL